ncbi:MAG: helix-turn-helix protein, partial [Mucilaginibacter sp.]|nr:helix-turn-helix protein [Mucilaginibacter sp.]
MKIVTVEDFYKNTAELTQSTVESLLPEGINKEIGHFNVFSLADIIAKIKNDPS